MYSNYFQFSSIFELVFIQLGGQSRCRSTNQPTAMRHFGHMVSFPAAAYFGLDLGKAVAWPCELSFSTCCCYDLSSLPPRNKKMRCKTTVRARVLLSLRAQRALPMRVRNAHRCAHGCLFSSHHLAFARNCT